MKNSFKQILRLLWKKITNSWKSKYPPTQIIEKVALLSIRKNVTEHISYHPLQMLWKDSNLFSIWQEKNSDSESIGCRIFVSFQKEIPDKIWRSGYREGMNLNLSNLISF